VRQCVYDRSERADLGLTLRAAGQVRFEALAVARIERAEGVGARQLAQFLVTHRA
jgi:hypothetical protein